jgi:hypothetical protein
MVTLAGGIGASDRADHPQALGHGVGRAAARDLTSRGDLRREMRFCLRLGVAAGRPCRTRRAHERDADRTGQGWIVMAHFGVRIRPHDRSECARLAHRCLIDPGASPMRNRGLGIGPGDWQNARPRQPPELDEPPSTGPSPCLDLPARATPPHIPLKPVELEGGLSALGRWSRPRRGRCAALVPVQRRWKVSRRQSRAPGSRCEAASCTRKPGQYPARCRDLKLLSSPEFSQGIGASGL